MELAQIANTWLTTLGRLAALAAAFGLLGWLMPCNRGAYWWKDLRAFVTDLVYWFVVPLFTRFATLAVLVCGIAWLYGGAEPSLLPVKRLPWWLQGVLVLIIQDVMLYWFHRAFHGRWGWRFHAVHHSPTVLDWTSTSRFHPVNQVFSFCLADAAVLLLGFSQEALAGLAVFNVVYSAFVHANLNWTFGPFRYVLASPVFHRWHHTTEKEGLDKNFASTFPVLDLVFGTFYMPAGKLPEHFGSGDPDMPESFVGQLLYPFRWAESNSLTAYGAGTMLSACAVVLVGLGGLMTLISTHGPSAAGSAEQASAEAGPHFTATTDASVLATAISADGRFFASTGMDGSVKRWEPATQQVVNFPRHARSAKAVAMSGDGSRLVSGGFDRTVRLWDAEQRELASRTEAMGVLGVAISADGETIASSGADGMVRTWKASGEVLASVQAGESVPGVALSPDGRRVAGACVDGVVRTWDAMTGKREHALRGPGSLAFCVALSEGGRRVVAGGHDGVMHVWDGESGERLFEVRAHQEGVLGVAITCDGARIVSGGGDGVVRVWDGRTGREECAFRRHAAAVTGVAVSADGKWAVSGSLDRTLKVWELPAPATGSKTAGGEEAAGE